jgi:cell fate regulator YaaT (PSP1 superfamily)
MGCCTSRSRGCFNIETEEQNNANHCQSTSLNKLDVHDWLAKYHSEIKDTDLVEVRFKNTRKSFYQNVNGLSLKQGDVVAVEASPGHDIGVVSLTGPLVKEQIAKSNIRDTEFKKIYRKAKPLDIEKWEEAQALEHETMIRSRVLASDLKLDMKIGDVEYQGDKTKAIFYYIADERVDFRQLIKILAEEFKIRIEMRQIGARQEAGRIGGIGSCGRELCCSGWLTSFSSVSTNAARDQELSLNPQKLAGQCGKLKCCLNFEVDVYKDAKKAFPDSRIVLETEDGPAYYQKSDVLQGIMWYSFNQTSAVNLTPVPVDRVKEIIKLNKDGHKVAKLTEHEAVLLNAPDFSNIVGQDSLTRFDKPEGSRRSRGNNRNQRRKKRNSNAQNNQGVAKDNSNLKENTNLNSNQPQKNQSPSNSSRKDRGESTVGEAPAETNKNSAQRGSKNNQQKQNGNNRSKNNRSRRRPQRNNNPKNNQSNNQSNNQGNNQGGNNKNE